MAIKRMDNVSVNVRDLDAAIAFLEALGMELEGRMVVEGEWVADVIGLEDPSSEIAMMRTADGGTKVELTRFIRPALLDQPEVSAPNAIGLRRMMFLVDDVRATVARLEDLGGELVRAIVNYEDVYELCYLRGPEGILFGISQEVGA
jgi:catechol 2,3-dioxygenase-like lactoylglutathione lyase family enzyme